MSRWETIVGAAPSAPSGVRPPTFSEAEAAADMAFDASGASAGFVIVRRDGTTAVTPFAASADASAAYDKVANAPGDAWYIALYDKAKALDGKAPWRVDETYFGGVPVPVVEPTRFGPAKALGAVAVASTLAIVAAGRKRQRRGA